ncbi:MAG: hypothetical protein ACK4NF_00140 [Planctomycetota bacterium]
MEERRKKRLYVPFFSTFQFIFLIVLFSLVLSLIILYYSFNKKIEKLPRVKDVKVIRFLELPHGQSLQIINNTPLQLDEEKIYYSLVLKILSLGNEFRTKCYEVAENAGFLSFYDKDKNLHLGVFKLTQLAVISKTTHFFEVPLKDKSRKVYHQLIAVDHSQRPYVIHFFEVPKFTIEEWKSSVNVCGVYYRNIKYENREGKEVTAPLFLTYTVEKFFQPKRKESPFTLIIVSVVAIMIVFLFFLRHKFKVQQLEKELKEQRRSV